MNEIQVDERVQLRQGIPELSLNRGDIGMVRSIWFSPNVAFEVEFSPPGSGGQMRALVMRSQIELLNAAALRQDGAEGAAV